MFNALTSYQGAIFSAVKKTKILAQTTVISAITNIVLNSILIPNFKVTGAAIATAISYFVMWIIRQVKMKKYIKLNHNFTIDILVYGLLIIQVIVEHTATHLILFQLLILISIILIYRKNYEKLILYIFKFIKRKSAK